jgi:hypothetical protein
MFFWRSGSFFASLAQSFLDYIHSQRYDFLMHKIPHKRIVIASMVGTTIGFYDFYIYATAAVSVFPLLFFPKGDAGAALLASMATFGVAFVARPIGSVFFRTFW